MYKFKISFLLIILISIINGFCNSNENSINTKPVLEVDGQEMPGWEKQIMEIYSDEEGSTLPVIFRGAAKNWKSAAWTPEYFAENFGDVGIQVFPTKVLEDSTPINTNMLDHIRDINLNSKNAAFFTGVIEHNVTEEIMSYIKKVKDDNAIFLYNQLDLYSQTQFPQLDSQGGEFYNQIYFLLIDSGNTIPELHSHASTFLAQVYGSRIATLINPKYIEKCYCKFFEEGEENDEKNEDYEEEKKFAISCDIDILNPDFEKFPELENIEIYQTIIEPGDVLYIPEGWLHDIRALGTTITVGSGF